PGTLVKWHAPSGPGVRVDEGYHVGMTVPGAFDSLVAKIIVTGADRDQAIARSRRALAELLIEGMPTVVPFHRAVLDDPAYTAPGGAFGVHTRWIETEFTGEIAPYTGLLGEDDDAPEPEVVVVEVNGKRVEVKLPGGFAARPAQAKTAKRPTKRDRGGSKVSAPSGNSLTSPMQGTIVKVNVE
ncbi:MAG: carbamoyl phosphate synthase, partial [Microthrixaceae bacterium]|nr:carbamoyl phosphate synthase [Microthrixaceae bacterium]